jgi:hypothetical protein
MGKWATEGGRALNGAVGVEQGTNKVRICCYVQRAAIPGKGFSLLHSKFMHALNILTCNVYISDIKEKCSSCAG